MEWTPQILDYNNDARVPFWKGKELVPEGLIAFVLGAIVVILFLYVMDATQGTDSDYITAGVLFGYEIATHLMAFFQLLFSMYLRNKGRNAQLGRFLGGGFLLSIFLMRTGAALLLALLLTLIGVTQDLAFTIAFGLISYIYILGAPHYFLALDPDLTNN